MSEARENADKRKEDMKRKIGRKIPKLHAKTAAFLEEIEQPRYLDMTDDIDDVLLDVQKFDNVCD